MRTVRLAPPTRRYVSNLTGEWVTAEQAVDPTYWVRHLRHTVRFAAGLRTVVADRSTVLVELGPGHALASYARRAGGVVGAISTLRHPDDAIDDTNHTLAAFAQLWIHGVDVDLDQLTGTGRRRLRLPTYPFKRERCWIEPGAGWALGVVGPVGSGPAVPERIASVDEMGFRPTWITAPDRPAADVVRRWVVVGGQSATDVADELRRRGRAVEVRARLGQMDDDDAQSESEPCGVVLVGEGASMEQAASLWLDDATAAAKWLGSSATAGRLVAVTRGALTVDAPARTPADALGVGVVMVGRREYAGLSTLLIDSDPERDPRRHRFGRRGRIGHWGHRSSRRAPPHTAPATGAAGGDRPGRGLPTRRHVPHHRGARRHRRGTGSPPRHQACGQSRARQQRADSARPPSVSGSSVRTCSTIRPVGACGVSRGSSSSVSRSRCCTPTSTTRSRSRPSSTRPSGESVASMAWCTQPVGCATA